LKIELSKTARFVSSDHVSSYTLKAFEYSDAVKSVSYIFRSSLCLNLSFDKFPPCLL